MVLGYGIKFEVKIHIFKQKHMDLKNTLTFLCFLFLTFSNFAQNKKDQPDLVSSYKEYTDLPRETVYAHLNKTTYFKGEIMGFTVYAFDKSTKKPSTTATNIYCTISDENNKLIKSELILANNGVANGSFQIDSLFTSGQYTFKTYTNWMRNFDEPNYYGQSVKIKDSEKEIAKKTKSLGLKVDAQFLPEGGHLVVDAINSVGVIIKDSLGFGVPNISGRVVDSGNTTITDFSTNIYGIGKFYFTPIASENYSVILELGEKQSFPIQKAENNGIVLTMNDLESKVAISFRTNNNTLPQIKKKKFTLAIHNGSTLKITEVSFGNSLEVVKVINYKDLSPGINIFTLFDENNKPILERSFFKYDGINLLTAGDPQIKSSKDSITIKIPIKNSKSSLTNNFSISVLPEGTASYNPTNNSISATYLQPYINSYVEDASYYFTNITRKKKIELDNVLLTQGWSSFDWNTVFNNPPKAFYNYENGIEFRANVNGKYAPEYIMYATINNEMKLFELEEVDKDFGAIGLYPMDTEELRFSSIKKNNYIERPNLYLQFSPSKIPDFNKTRIYAPLNDNLVNDNYFGSKILKASWDNAEQLEEVVIHGNKKLTREEKLTRTAFGKVKVIDDQIRKSYLFFGDYIRTQGFKVYETMGQLLIMNPRPVSFGQGQIVTMKGSLPNTYNTSIYVKPVIVYLNNIPLKNTDILYKYSMDEIDYITIDKSGTSEGGLGVPGVIKIFTDPLKAQNKMKRNITQNVSVPLTFTSSKKFYVPEYSSYLGKFYQDYGVIDWFPQLKIQEDGNLQFTILKPKTNSLRLFIEGTANNGSFISDQKTIILP